MNSSGSVVRQACKQHYKAYYSGKAVGSVDIPVHTLVSTEDMYILTQNCDVKRDDGTARLCTAVVLAGIIGSDGGDHQIEHANGPNSINGAHEGGRARGRHTGDNDHVPHSERHGNGRRGQQNHVSEQGRV